MSRLGRRRRSLTVVATAALALAVPAAAHAATYTVKTGDGACGPGDSACGGLVEAAAAAASGDVFNVAAGTYTAAKFTTDVDIRGDLGFTVDGTLEFAGGGVSKLSKVAVATGAGNAPAIYVSGGGGLELSDAVVVSRDGFGVFITAGLGNKIVRTAVATGGTATGAIQVETGPGTGGHTSPDTAVTIDSTITYGGGAGIRAFTRNNETEAIAGNGAGDITLALHHVTAAGSSNGIDIDASNARSLIDLKGIIPQIATYGHISATVSDSIALNNRVARYEGVLNLGAPLGANTAELVRTRTLESADPATLFIDPAKGNFRLRPDAAAAIGQGGFTPGESTTDIDGEDRSAAPTDLGADEYNNAAPTAKIAVATAAPRSAQPVTFDGRGSTDRDGQATIAEYRWRFSDGSAVNTTQPFVQHTFADEGDAAAGLVVVDKQGAASPEVAVTFKLANGTPPAVAIVKPKSKHTFHRFTTTTKTVTRKGKKVKTKKRVRTKIQIAGLSKPKTGTTMSKVLLVLQKTKSTTSKTKCRYYSASKGLRLVSCSRPILITARLVKGSTSGEWVYNVPTKRPLSTGSWKVSAYGVDSTGAFGNAADKGASLSFRVKK
jgi:hypothetical protein